jgi:ABC-type nitrate/sulfonate/bicarbonate transport system permease component
MPDRARARAWLGGAAGLAGLVAVWWLLAVTVFDGSSMPTPPGVLRQYGADGWAFYANNFGGTVVEAMIGFAWGNGLALVLAALVLLTPRLEPVISQIAVISYCVPTIAILPILYIVLGPPDPGEPAPTAVVLAALSVFFTTVVGAVLGFRSADRAALDVVHVYGGGRWRQLVTVQVVSALPEIISALKIAAPAAFLGAILGEYIGGVDRGVGPALIAAGQGLMVERAWGIMFACALVAGLGYAAFGVLGRVAVPWSTGGGRG